MGRIQKGSIYEASGSFYVRYYTGETRVNKNGATVPEQASAFLCEKNDKYYSRKAKSVRLLLADFINKVNQEAASRRAVDHAVDLSVTAFWDQVYLPYCEQIVPLTGKPRKKPSTIRGYKQVWNQHLKKHFGTMTLQEYEPHMGTRLLQSLISTQGKTTLKHIRAVGSAIFRHAVVEQRIKVNPWHDVVMPDGAIESESTKHYTMEEAENLISALVDHVDAQLVMALACFLGLGPAEIAGLQWGDIDEDWIHIRRNKLLGEVVTPKTKERMASLPMLDQVRLPLELWRKKAECTDAAWWVIPDLHNLVGRVIKPHVRGKECSRCEKIPAASGVEWKGLYAGRRGACTAVVEATGGNYAVAQALLRHKRMTTTLNVYKKQITPEAFKAGMSQFQKSLKGI